MKFLEDWWFLVVFLAPILFGAGVGIVTKSKERIEHWRIARLLDERDKAFLDSFARGRRWLPVSIAEARQSVDEQLELHLRYKKHPAIKAAEAVKEIRLQKRELTTRVKELEYQLRSYEEYFPFLEEYREAILDERVRLGAGLDNIAAIEETDPVALMLTDSEYKSLSTASRNQLALDRYLQRPKSNLEIGRLYERYIDYLYETDGWRVSYHGAIRGYEDFGRDLICARNSGVEIVQAKCWSKDKFIREKHVFQLFGTTIHYQKTARLHVQPVLAVTTNLSDEACEVANALQVRIDRRDLTLNYPMIKCNVSARTGEKIYHLPFDQQYDKVIVGDRAGEKYVSTVIQAEQLGFRRAFKYRPPE